MIWILGIYLFPAIVILIWLYIIAEPGDSLWDILYQEDIKDIFWVLIIPVLNYIFLGIFIKNHIHIEIILSKFVKDKKKK